MAEKQDKLVPLTVRFTGPAVETIRTVAKEHGLSLAEIIRFTMDNKLSEYLGSIQFVDYDQGKDIEKELHVLINMTQKVGQELNRIGVNYNQEIKLRHLQERYDAKKMTIDARLQWKKEYDEVVSGQSTLSKDDLEELMTRYEAVAERIGKVLQILNG